jgi:hypothetical protein
MAKKKKKQREELSEVELETVSGGLNFTDSPLEAKVATSDGATTSPVLTKACATGEHIPKTILTIR